MGCDIHAVIEYVPFPPRAGEEKNWWNFAVDVEIPRYYALFNRMAGVRGRDEPSMFEPRGFPDRLSFAANIYFKTEEGWAGDHTPSWLYADEFLQCVEGLGVGGELKAICAAVESLGKSFGDKNVRIVFNFDS